jgi:hypothetical protein
VRTPAVAVASPKTGALLFATACYGNGGVFSSQCTVIFGSEASL